MFQSVFRVFRFASHNFFRNIWLSITTLTVIMLTLISVNSLGFLNVLTLEAAEAVKERVDVSVYFKSDVTPQDVKAIQEKLSQSDKIKQITYISREDSLKMLQKRHEGDVVISDSLKELGKNPLGDTLVIKAYDIYDYPLILEALEQSQYKGLIQDKNYQDNQIFLNKIANITDKVKKVGWIITMALAVVSILIVFNTIRIAIYTHSEEISIMKLVGAENWFIRAPFVIESLGYAVIGTALTLLALSPVLELIDPYVLSFFDNSFSISAYYLSNVITIALWNFVGVLFLTTLASSLAVGRYLNV